MLCTQANTKGLNDSVTVWPLCWSTRAKKTPVTGKRTVNPRHLKKYNPILYMVKSCEIGQIRALYIWSLISETFTVITLN